MRLSPRDYDAALRFLREAYVLRTVDEFADHLVHALGSLVPSERTSYTMCQVVLDSPTSRRPYVDTRSDTNPPLPDPKIFERHILDHPLIVHHERPGARRPLYNEFFRPLDTEYQAAFSLPVPPPLALGLSVSRQRRDFSDRDCAVLSVLQPHLAQAHQNAAAVTQLRATVAASTAALDEIEEGVVALGPRGQVRFMTRRARQWLDVYFPRKRGQQLPDAIRDWVHDDAVRAVGARGRTPRRPLVVTRTGRRLTVRFVANAGESLLMMTEQTSELPIDALAPLGLSRREAEVLRWAAEGKRNSEIAIILRSEERRVG